MFTAGQLPTLCAIHHCGFHAEMTTLSFTLMLNSGWSVALTLKVCWVSCSSLALMLNSGWSVALNLKVCWVSCSSLALMLNCC